MIMQLLGKITEKKTYHFHQNFYLRLNIGYTTILFDLLPKSKMESLYLFFIAFIGIMGSYITWQQYRPPQKITWHNIPLSITIILISIMLAIRCYASDWCQYYSLFLQYQTGYDPLREPEFLWQGITGV